MLFERPLGQYQKKLIQAMENFLSNYASGHAWAGNKKEVQRVAVNVPQ